MQQFRLEEALTIAQKKSGSLVSMVCSLAASEVTTEEDLMILFARLGELVGTAYQLDNDIHDLSLLLAMPSDTALQPAKTDLQRKKKTLPIVLASEQYAQLCQLVIPSPMGADQETEMQGRAYEQAITAALGVAFYYRLQAKDLAEEIESHQGFSMPLPLRFLLSLDGLPSIPTDDKCL